MGRVHEFGLDTDICVHCGLAAVTIEDFSARCGQKWARRGRVIKDFATGEEIRCASKNEAKRRSRSLQQGGKGLGRGELRLIP